MIGGLLGGGAGPGRGEDNRLRCGFSRGRRGRRCAGSGRAPGRWPRGGRCRCRCRGLARRRRRAAGRGRRTGRGRARRSGGRGSARAAGGGLGRLVPARLAAAGTLMSGPGCRPSSRNIRAASVVSCRKDQENTARTLSRRIAGIQRVQAAGGIAQLGGQRGSAGTAGRAAARAAATASASGRHAHRRGDLVDGAGLRRRPGRRRAGRPAAARASAWLSTSRVSSRAPSAAASPVSWLRLVISTRLPGLAGQQRPDLLLVAGVVQHDQHPPVRQQAAVQARLRLRVRRDPRPGTPRASRNPRMAASGRTGVPEGSKPRRFTYSCPSGNRSATWCAQCSGQRGLADPGRPADRARSPPSRAYERPIRRASW